MKIGFVGCGCIASGDPRYLVKNHEVCALDTSAPVIEAVRKNGILVEDEVKKTRKVLGAAALTYVAALLMSLLQLLRFVLIFIGRGGGRDRGGSR